MRLIAGQAAKIPAAGYAAAPAWTGAIHQELQSGLFNPTNGDFIGSVLPTLTKVDLQVQKNHQHAEPIVHYMTQELGIDLKSFQAMPPDDKRSVLLMASEEASSAIRWDASLAMAEATGVLFPPGASPSSLESVEASAKMLREFRTKYALFLQPEELKEVRKLHIQTQERAAVLRGEKVSSKGADIAGRLGDGKEKLQASDIGIAVTDGFNGDTSGWKDNDWERLERELEKIRQILASGEQQRGQIGNIKFLAGPLSGLAEIKFGANRTHRVFFKYHPKTKKVVFLKVLARESMNKNNGYIEELQAFKSNAVLEAKMKTPPADIPLMKKVTADDLDIRLDP
jgi:hypothetical protein